MIEFKNVSFSYDSSRKVLDNVSFTIADGESVGLIGANGAGKSTVLKLLLGLLFPDEGSIFVDGIEVSKKTLPEIRKKLGFVLQDSDNQMFMPTVYEDMIFGPLNYGVSRTEVDKKADEVLEKLGISSLKNRRNHQISGGEKRMAAIATVLTMEPEIVLMDEPTASLDPYNRRILINTAKGLSETKIVTSHDLDMILAVCERVILLSGGRIAADGPSEAVLRDKTLLEANRMELPLCLSGRP